MNGGSVEGFKSKMYVSGNPSVSYRPSLNAEESLIVVESVDRDKEGPKDVHFSEVSVPGTGLSLTQEWSSMRDDKDSEPYESQIKSLYVATENPEPSVRELAKIAPQDNLQESIAGPQSKFESELAES
jgi:hypothetical protein